MSVHRDEGGSSLPERAACHVRRWSNRNPDELLRDRPRQCAQIESGVTDIRAIEHSAGEIGPDEAGVGEIGTVQIGSAQRGKGQVCTSEGYAGSGYAFQVPTAKRQSVQYSARQHGTAEIKVRRPRLRKSDSA